MLQTTCDPIMVIDPASIRPPEFKVNGILYFLEGHFLFRYPDGDGMSSKFVTVADVMAAIHHVEIDSGWFAAGTVRTGRNANGLWYVYSPPAQNATIIIDGESLLVPLPRTVLLGTGLNYYVWALHSKHFDPGERAYKAPFPNVNDNGSVCWGSNTPGEASPGKARQVWELFFASPFNDHLVNGKSKKCEKDIRSQLRSLAGTHTYPANDLVPLANGFTIGRVIDSLLEVR
ncbi:MAG: hypothetical protein GYA58_03385 [Anaerolineaceae bacterium]|nr:hypothetical protein [Anaerolineaceae bacterium]